MTSDVLSAAAKTRADRVRDALERWNRGERDVGADLAHPEIELRMLFTAVEGEPYRGVEGLRRWLLQIDENFEDWSVSIGSFQEAGNDRLIAMVNVHLKARQSGVELDQPIAWVIEFEDDLVRLIQSYASHEEALRATQDRD